MKKNINFKYIAVIMMLFSFTETAYAKENFVSDTNAKSLYEKCNEESKCIPICTYKSGESEISYIGYYMNDKKWEIGIFNPDAPNHENLYTEHDTRLPKSMIYWEDYGYENNTTWDKGPKIRDGKNAYEQVYENFKCPAYVNQDYQVNVELCFSNSAGKCKDQGKGHISIKFHDDYPIEYSFGDTLKKVIDETYDELHIDDSSSEDKKAKFLHDMDPDNIAYDSNKSGKENVQANCEIIKKKMEDENSYANELIGKSDDFTQIIDNKLTETAKKIDTRNGYIYNMKDLGGILSKSDTEKRDIKDSEGTLYADKLSNIYVKSVYSSIKYYGEICGFEFDEAKFIEKTREEFETRKYNLPKIDLDSKFDCNSISEIADLISTAYFIIEILALVLLVGLTILDYAKVILSGEQDEMKKSNKRLLTRLIIATLILLLPMLINLVLGIFHIEGFDSENPLCVEIKNK